MLLGNLADRDDTSSEILERNGWRPKLPASPLALEHVRLADCRHPAERPMLAIAVLIVAALSVTVILLREKEMLIAGALIYLSMLITSIQAKTYYRLRGAEVTPSQFPEIYTTIEELRQRFQAPPVRAFVLRRFGVEAEIFGMKAPYTIVLPSSLLDAVELPDLRYVIGRALGQICLGHTRVAILMGGERSALPAALSWIAWLRDLIFTGYWRAETMSADRAGILACGEIEQALRSQVKISVGSKQLESVRAADLIEQASKVSQGLTRLQAISTCLQSPLPPLIPRLLAMVAWAGWPL